MRPEEEGGVRSTNDTMKKLKPNMLTLKTWQWNRASGIVLTTEVRRDGLESQERDAL